MGKTIDKKRALSFGKSAKLYDEMRPHYPDTWINDLRVTTKLNDSSVILEVGSGTGIATNDLLKLSKHITCLDPDLEMLELAKTKFPHLTFRNSTFEDFKSKDTFDLIISATAWHWVDPEVGYLRASELLREGGYLAIIRYYHIDTDPKSFHNRAQHIYEQYDDATITKRHTEQLKRIKQDAEALNNQLFKLIKQKEYKWVRDYSIGDYLALRNTYSDHLTMAKQQKAKMEEELTDFANAEFVGKVKKKYTTVLFIAQKR